MRKVVPIIGLIFALSSGRAESWLDTSYNSSGRIFTYVADEKISTRTVLTIRSEVGLGDNILEISDVYSDLSGSCKKYMYLGQTAESYVIERHSYSVTMKPTDLLYTIFKDKKALIDVEKLPTNKIDEYAQLSLICLEPHINKQAEDLRVNMYIPIYTDKVYIGDLWNRAKISLNVVGGMLIGFKLEK